MNRGDRVFLDPPEVDETNPSGEGRNWQSDGIGNRYGVNEKGDADLISGKGVDQILLRASEGLPSISSSDEGDQRGLRPNVSTATSISPGPASGGCIATTERWP